MIKKIKYRSWTLPSLMIFTLLVILLLAGLIDMVAYAANGLMPETVKEGSRLLSEKYPMENYDLDFAVVKDDGLLGFIWGMADGPTDMLNGVLFSITTIFWWISRGAYQVVIFLIEQAYNFDIVSGVLEQITQNMKNLLGVSKNGFTSEGFFPQLLIFTLLAIGGYILFVGLYKRQFTKAYKAVINYVIVFLLSIVFVLSSDTYVKTINDFSNAISTSILDIGKNMVSLSSAGMDIVETDNPVDSIKEMLFVMQVRQPYLYLQFGGTDIERIGNERVKALESKNRNTKESSEALKEAVEKEITEENNNRVTKPDVMLRLLDSLLIMIMNVILSLFVGFLAVVMLLSHILFMAFLLYMPILFMIGLIPGLHQVAYNGIVKAFSYLCMKIGISVILMIAFTMSMFCYSFTKGLPLLVVMVIQIICFYAVYRSLGSMSDLLGIGGTTREVTEKIQVAKEKLRTAKTKVLNGGRAVAAYGARGVAAGVTGGASEASGLGNAVTSTVKEENHRQTKSAVDKSNRERNSSDLYSGNNKTEGQVDIIDRWKERGKNIATIDERLERTKKYIKGVDSDKQTAEPKRIIGAMEKQSITNDKQTQEPKKTVENDVIKTSKMEQKLDDINKTLRRDENEDRKEHREKVLQKEQKYDRHGLGSYTSDEQEETKLTQKKEKRTSYQQTIESQNSSIYNKRDFNGSRKEHVFPHEKSNSVFQRQRDKRANKNE